VNPDSCDDAEFAAANLLLTMFGTPSKPHLLDLCRRVLEPVTAFVSVAASRFSAPSRNADQARASAMSSLRSDSASYTPDLQHRKALLKILGATSGLIDNANKKRFPTHHSETRATHFFAVPGARKGQYV
jgi:hypothetical protein